MSVRDELLFDFSLKMPRVIVSGNIVIVDHVKRIVMYSSKRIVLHNGKRYTWIEGKDLIIKELKDERVLITGEPEQFRFLETLHKIDTGGK